MDKVDFVLVGSEAVVESGGLINAVGSNQIAIIAKAANKPFYALAERFFTSSIMSGCLLTGYRSYKFHRLFPLSQYDLPSHNHRVLSFSTPQQPSVRLTSRPSATQSIGSTLGDATGADDSDPSVIIKITQEKIAQNNPDVDYTRCVVVSLSRSMH